MAVTIGDVATFPNVKPNKAQVMKIAEETLEVFSAWEDWDTWHERVKRCSYGGDYGRLLAHFADSDKRLLDECADVIQAISNLIAALGVDDFTEYMQDCKERNHDRGRL